MAKCTGASAGLGDLYYTTGEYWRNIVKATWMIGIAFGLKLGLTNYGLDLVSSALLLLHFCSPLSLPLSLSAAWEWDD